MTDAVAPIDHVEPRRDRATAGSYLDRRIHPAQWLLTTDHKRIAMLYAIVDHRVLLHRRRGGGPDPARADRRRTGIFLGRRRYNRLFTLHGIIMVWFFLVPLDSRHASAISCCR